jgi:hypothetical protein
VEEIKGKTVADMVIAATGVKHLYHKIFAVNDADYERIAGELQHYSSEALLLQATQTVVDIDLDTQRLVGRAGYVNGVLVGNGGNYLDARWRVQSQRGGQSQRALWRHQRSPINSRAWLGMTVCGAMGARTPSGRR